MSLDISFSDYLAVQNMLFEWAESYDTKDWDRLKKVLAPSIYVDYSKLGGEINEKATPDEFAATVSGFIGDYHIKSQHLLGLSRWNKLNDGSIEVESQSRVAHQRYAAADLTEAVNHGHSHGTISHTVRKFGNIWKIIKYVPKSSWTEYDVAGTVFGDKASNKV